MPTIGTLFFLNFVAASSLPPGWWHPWGASQELLQIEDTAIGFFNAKIARSPDHLGRTVLWVGASTLYDMRRHPDQDVRQRVVAAWL